MVSGKIRRGVEENTKEMMTDRGMFSSALHHFFLIIPSLKNHPFPLDQPTCSLFRKHFYQSGSDSKVWARTFANDKILLMIHSATELLNNDTYGYWQDLFFTQKIDI